LRAGGNSLSQNPPSNHRVPPCDMYSAVYARARTKSRRNCVRPANVVRSLTGDLPRGAAYGSARECGRGPSQHQPNLTFDGLRLAFHDGGSSASSRPVSTRATSRRRSVCPRDFIDRLARGAADCSPKRSQPTTSPRRFPLVKLTWRRMSQAHRDGCACSPHPIPVRPGAPPPRRRPRRPAD